MGDVMKDSNGNLIQRIGTVRNASKIELAIKLKSTGLQDLFLDEEDFDFFTDNFGKGVMLLGSEIFAAGTRWSRDFQSVVSFYPDAKRRFHW